MMATVILTISIIVSLVINISLLFVGEKSRSKTILSICLYTIAGISGVMIAILNRPKLEEIGSLKPKNKSYDKSYPYEDRVAFYPPQTVKIGTLVEKAYPLGNNIPFLVIREKNGLMISTKVTSQDGKIVAKMIKNVWQSNQGNYFRKFHDESAIEIIDHYGIPILQVEYIDYNTIKIGGVFRPEQFPVYETDIDFMQSRDAKEAGAAIYSVSIQIIGKKGLSTSGAFNEMKVEEFNTIAKKHIEPWFDYSNPSKPSRRLNKK